MAEALGYPRELLDWPDEPVGLGPSGFYHRKQSGLGETALQRIEAEVTLLLMQLRRLEASVGIEPIYRLPVLDADEHTPEQAAAEIRASWLLPDGPVHDVIRTVERAGVVVVRRDLESPKISGVRQRLRPPRCLSAWDWTTAQRVTEADLRSAGQPLPAGGALGSGCR